MEDEGKECFKVVIHLKQTCVLFFSFFIVSYFSRFMYYSIWLFLTGNKTTQTLQGCLILSAFWCLCRLFHYKVTEDHCFEDLDSLKANMLYL